MKRGGVTGRYLKRRPVESSVGPIFEIQNYTSNKVVDPEAQLKQEALDILDCLTCPKDESDPAYDVEKDVMRDELLQDTDYSELKTELRARGLRTKGDKLEMMIRMMLHVIDPSIDFNEMTGREPTLSYISKKDVEEGKVRIVPLEQRNTAEEDTGPDAEDLVALRKSSSSNVGGLPGKKKKKNAPKIIMDGLTRKEVDFFAVNVVTPPPPPAQLGDAPMNRAYIVAGRDVLQTWEKLSPVVVLVPDEEGWRSKDTRVFADELAFYNQAIVIVPDLFHNQSKDSLFDCIVSALRFAFVEYESKAVSIAGIGTGGGTALTIAAEIARLTYFSDAKVREGVARQQQKNLDAYNSRAIVLDDPVESNDGGDSPLMDMGIDLSEFNFEELTNSSSFRFLDEVGGAEDEDYDAEIQRKPHFVRSNSSSSSPEFPFKPLTNLSIHLNSSLTLFQLASLIPTAVLAIRPRDYDISSVGHFLLSPLFAVFGNDESQPGAR